LIFRKNCASIHRNSGRYLVAMRRAPSWSTRIWNWMKRFVIFNLVIKKRWDFLRNWSNFWYCRQLLLWKAPLKNVLDATCTDCWSNFWCAKNTMTGRCAHVRKRYGMFPSFDSIFAFNDLLGFGTGTKSYCRLRDCCAYIKKIIHRHSITSRSLSYVTQPVPM
jgi:hypothetical protein